MRHALSAALVAAALVAAAPAYADCIGPYECFCTFTSTTPEPVVIGVVTALQGSDEDRRATIEVESVHAPEGIETPVVVGDALTRWVEDGVEVGARLLFSLDPDGAPRRFGTIEERDDGSVACGGFSSRDLALSDIVEVRTSSICFEALNAKGAEYEVPECNDVVTGPFSCRSGGAPADAGWGLLALVGLIARRRRKRT